MHLIKIYLLCFLTLGSALLNAQISTTKAIQVVWQDSVTKSQLPVDLSIVEALDSIYSQNNFHPIFNHGMRAMYLNYLDATKVWGFNPEHYDYSLLDSLQKSKMPSLKAAFDYYAASSYIRLYEDIINGTLKGVSTRGYKNHFELEKLDVVSVLIEVEQLPSINHLKLVEPQIDAYQESKHLLERYWQDTLSSTYDFTFVDTLSIGDRDSLVVLLRHKLHFLGDLKTSHRLRSPIFDKDLVIALNDFKLRHLLPADSILDEKTVKVLNTPIAGIVTELQLNLERWRWLPHSLGAYYAIANLPAYEMSLVKNDTLLMKQRIVCGKVSRSTPTFMDTMRYMDINPTWTVPPTILQKDILPSAKSSGTYLSRKNIRVLDVTTGTYINSSEINWAKSKNYKFVQGPGLSNALGVVKFIFPNPYYIFFHDTPHKEHFPLAYRAYSSGCIRLQHPRDFAEVLLTNNDVSFTRAEIDSIVDTQKTKRVLLNEKPMVYITYLTQDVQEGLLYTYPDVYGYNEDLKKQLRLAQGY